MSKLEVEIEDRYVEECSKIGVKAEKFKRQGKKGGADRIVFIPKGKTIFIEFKRPGGEASPHQIEFLDMMDSLGFPCYILDSWEEALKITKRKLYYG